MADEVHFKKSYTQEIAELLLDSKDLEIGNMAHEVIATDSGPACMDTRGHKDGIQNLWSRGEECCE
jgi:hypothetical protein